MSITCCRHCVPPRRYPGCHDKCEEYIKQKELHEKMKEQSRRERVKITKFDFYKVNVRPTKHNKKH